MSRKKTVAFCVLGGTALSVIAMSCTDYLTGQTPEPDGPLLVTKLTLLDKVSRDKAVFTDTSLPNCMQYPADVCSQDANRNSFACRTCYNDVLKDTYSLAKSPPTPDSATDLRVVFNKIPRKWNGSALNPDDVPDMALRLQCGGTCQGIPTYKRLLDISGSSLTYDPTDIPYGPSLRIAVDRSVDPRVALEPGASYSVFVDVGLSDRSDNRLDGAQAQALLSFKTEPLTVLQMGRGDSKADPYVYASTKYGDGGTGNPYSIADLPRNSAIVLKLNASIHPDALGPLKLTGSFKRADGSTGAVDVLVGTNIWATGTDGSVTRDPKTMGCIQQNQRLLAMWPDTPDLKWPMGAVEVTFTLTGGTVKDVAQKAGFPMGVHALAGDVTVRARLTTADAPSGYTGLTTQRAKVSAGACPQLGGADMATLPDMAVSDMTAKDM